MGIFALVLGILGGLCTVMGILVTLEFAPAIGSEFTWAWWFSLSMILFLATIVSLLVQSRSD
jgi:hypothetical protein